MDNVIGRVKRAPHWGVQSRFRVIYIYVYVGLSVCLKETHTKKWYAKMRGRNYVCPNTRMLKVSFVSLKQSAALKP